MIYRAAGPGWFLVYNVMATKKLNTVLLIDDDRNDNFYHEREILKTDPGLKVVTKSSGIEALEYFKTAPVKPGLIFLDINMPIWDGWAFLLEFGRLEKEVQGDVTIIVLTSSRNPTDELRAKAWGFVSGFIIKPLTKDKMEEVLRKHFVDGEK
jgi:CheY-like chemotaxis protein